MGGGGTMRAAAKVAGFTVANHGRRVFAVDHPRPPVSSIRSAASAHPLDEMKLVSSPTHQNATVSSEMDDWVFAGFVGEEEEEEDVIPRRVVFRGGAPTLQEAKEATSELADALEKAYLSSPMSVGFNGSSTVDNSFGSSLSNSQVENKACVTSEVVARPPAPNHAIQAFKLLHESSVAQSVVASIACDQNVWNAVLKNPHLQEFLHSQRTSEYERGPADFDVHDDESSAKSVVYNNSGPDNGFMDFVEKIKSIVVDMMSSLSSFFQNFFGGYKVFANSDATARVSADTVMEASFMGLAVMAIMVILLKRA